MTNATENANGRARVAMAGALQDQINDLCERANDALETAREYREKAKSFDPDSWAYLNCKKQELYHMGKRSAWCLAADNLEELLHDSMRAAQRVAS